MQQFAPTQNFVVTKVIDGDTLEISPEIPLHVALQPAVEKLREVRYAGTSPAWMENPRTLKRVRLAHINTPELGTPHGDRAALFLKHLLEGKRVTLRPLGVSYDRVVADVWRYPDNVFVNAAMLYKGYAKRA